MVEIEVEVELKLSYVNGYSYPTFSVRGGVGGGWVGWLEKWRIKLSQLPTKLKLKLS